MWRTFVGGVRPGQLYGYKVLGAFDPAAGKRFNGAKLLIDPYARALSHKASNADNMLLAYDGSSEGRDLSVDTRDNRHLVPKAIVVGDAFDWKGDASPAIPFERLIIYEVHARGFTAHPSSRARNPGTYLGFAEKVPYLKRLGVNAVELLPVHECYIEDFIRGRSPNDPGRYYANYTGCGNSLNLTNPAAIRLHGLVALLGGDDARGRLPLRPRVGART